mgnify:CR=1 FL=1
MTTTTMNTVATPQEQSLLERLSAAARRIAKIFKLSPQSDFGAGLGARGF